MSGQGVALITVCLSVALICLGLIVYSLQRWLGRLDGRTRQRDQQIQAELDALRAAGRINLAFWTARQQMGAEAQRHRVGGRQ